MYQILDAFTNLEAPWNMIVWVVAIGSVAGIVSTIVTQIRNYASHRVDMNLKRELVERGLSAEEIERIVAAKSPNDGHADDS